MSKQDSGVNNEEEAVFEVPSAEEPPLENILVPTDGTEAVKKGVEMIAPIAACCQGTIHALSVYPPGSHTRDRIRSDPITDAEELVESFARELTRGGLQTESAVRTGLPDEEIRGYAEENDIDLIVMVTHPSSPLNILRRSVTKSVIRKSDIPVMVISE